jgi:ATP-dependent Clp protease ATP-binding subunit ClpC
MDLAAEEARAFNHTSIGAEHLLIALANENSNIAILVLRRLGVDQEKVRSQVAELVPRGAVAPSGRKLRQSTHFKRVIEFAMQEAFSLGHNYVGTEHLLMAVVHARDETTAQVLANLGLDSDDVRRDVLSLIGHGP